MSLEQLVPETLGAETNGLLRAQTGMRGRRGRKTPAAVHHPLQGGRHLAHPWDKHHGGGGAGGWSTYEECRASLGLGGHTDAVTPPAKPSPLPSTPGVQVSAGPRP